MLGTNIAIWVVGVKERKREIVDLKSLTTVGGVNTITIIWILLANFFIQPQMPDLVAAYGVDFSYLIYTFAVLLPSILFLLNYGFIFLQLGRKDPFLVEEQPEIRPINLLWICGFLWIVGYTSQLLFNIPWLWEWGLGYVTNVFGVFADYMIFTGAFILLLFGIHRKIKLLAGAALLNMGAYFAFYLIFWIRFGFF